MTKLLQKCPLFVFVRSACYIICLFIVAFVVMQRSYIFKGHWKDSVVHLLSNVWKHKQFVQTRVFVPYGPLDPLSFARRRGMWQWNFFTYFTNGDRGFSSPVHVWLIFIQLHQKCQVSLFIWSSAQEILQNWQFTLWGNNLKPRPWKSEIFTDWVFVQGVF